MKHKLKEKNVFDTKHKNKKNNSIFDEIKASSFKRKYSKILKFLTSKNINSNDINFQKKIYGKNDTILVPDFVCYQPNYVQDQENIFLVVIYNQNKENIENFKLICKECFYHLDNLFFVLIFDKDLNAHLFFRKEEQDQTHLLHVREKHIAKFN